MSQLQHRQEQSNTPVVDKPGLVAELRQLLPAAAVIHETEALRPYECDGLTAYRSTPMLAVLPGLAIVLMVLGLNLLGDGLRDALDPKLRS